jgi:hypothetical protein
MGFIKTKPHTLRIPYTVFQGELLTEKEEE